MPDLVDETTLEKDLIRQAQIGSAQTSAAAISELYRRHAPAVFRYCLWRVGNTTVAEDLTGDVFIRMLEHLPTFEERGVPFAAWLYQIAYSRVVDYHRRKGNQPTPELTEFLPDLAQDLEAHVEQALDLQHLKLLLADLTEEQQVVVQCRFIEGYTVEETARQLGKTEGAVKAMQHRALRHLARQLAERMENV